MVYSDKLYPLNIYKFDFDFFNNFKFSLMKLKLPNNAHEFESVDADIMQYTGMKDINEKDIYEGDIVKRIDHTPMASQYGKEEIGVIKYVKSFKFNKNINYEFNSGVLNHFGIMASYEVIGSIYENSDLLGEC